MLIIMPKKPKFLIKNKSVKKVKINNLKMKFSERKNKNSFKIGAKQTTNQGKNGCKNKIKAKPEIISQRLKNSWLHRQMIF